MFGTDLKIEADAGSLHISGRVVRSHKCQIGIEDTLAPAIAGTISLWTSKTAGELTLAAGHGLVEGDTVDVYWDVGRRYGCTVGAVDGLIVPISGGDGNDLSDAPDIACTAAKMQTISTIVFPNLQVIAALANARVCLRCFNDEATQMFVADLVAGELWEWWVDGVRESPLARGIGAFLYASQAGTAAAADLKMGIGVT